MQQLVRNSQYADCKRHSCSHIQNAYNGPQHGAKHKIVPLEKLQCIRVLVRFEAGTKSSKLSQISSVIQNKIEKRHSILQYIFLELKCEVHIGKL